MSALLGYDKDRTDINEALTYCQQIVTKPADTVLVLITNLYEGGNVTQMRNRAVEVAAGVQLVVLLALNDGEWIVYKWPCQITMYVSTFSNCLWQDRQVYQ